MLIWHTVTTITTILYLLRTKAGGRYLRYVAFYVLAATKLAICYTHWYLNGGVMSDHRKNFFRWMVSIIFCCWNSNAAAIGTPSNTFSPDNNINIRRVRAVESVEMRPMSLRDYVNTLEPYDPEKHGWRGEEPWRYRSCRRSQLSDQTSISSSCDEDSGHLHIKTTFNGVGYQYTNCNVLFHETPV